jgi:Cu/Ag efflux pump CusA
LTTDAALSLDLLPLAILSGEPGNEIEGPMAMVILDGLFTVMLLDRLVLPALMLMFGDSIRPNRRLDLS